MYIQISFKFLNVAITSKHKTNRLDCLGVKQTINSNQVTEDMKTRTQKYLKTARKYAKFENIKALDRFLTIW